ncbi:hypothetical protein ACFFRR_004517 [Megaselia abdita]
MKLILSALLVTVALVSALPLNEEPEGGWFVPNEDGSFYWMSEKESQDIANGINGRAATIKLYLYTRSNPTSPESIDPSSSESLKRSHFDSRHPTRIIIHGWKNSYLDAVNVDLRKAYLEHGEYNVICVDWSANAKTVNYPLAAQRVKGVGKQVAAFIDLAHEHNGLSFESLEVDGHSLGAHCAGFAGKNVKRGRIHVIRGLDPALPLFSYDKPADRLASTDAYYVESIQTNGGKLGFLKPIGKAAFYPNGGKSQPGCGIDVSGSCSHARSYEYYAEAIVRNDFPSMRCSDYELAVKKDCGKSYSANKLGAASNDHGASGSFYTPVNKKSPFGKEA